MAPLHESRSHRHRQEHSVLIAVLATYSRDLMGKAAGERREPAAAAIERAGLNGQVDRPGRNPSRACRRSPANSIDTTAATP